MSAGLLQAAYRPPPERRHTGDHNAGSLPASPVSISRNSSVSSIKSHKSEPGWLTSMNGVDRSRAGSTASQTSHTSTKSSSGGLSKLFGGKSKSDKEKKKDKKKDLDQIVLTSRHAAAVKTKLALDPKYKKAVQKEPQAQGPLIVGTQNSAHLTAQEQEMRRPHSGPPSLTRVLVEKSGNSGDGMPALTRIISGDEADEPDDWERLREEWRTRKIPGVEMLQVLEGETLDGAGNTTSSSSSGTATPEETEDAARRKSFELPETTTVEKQGVRLVAAAQVTVSDSEELKSRPERRHTPIGGRWKKDEKGVWKR